MDDASIQKIVDEIGPRLVHRAPGKIYQFGSASLAIDFGLRREGLLFVSVDPALPRMYLLKRRVRELERQHTPLNQFGLALRKELANTNLTVVAKDPSDRVVRFHFAGEDEMGQPKQCTLIAQLTGRSADLLLLDERYRIIQTARPVEHQSIGDNYSRPGGEHRRPQKSSQLLIQINSGTLPSASEAADRYYASLLAQRESEARANAVRSKLRKKISQHEKLLKQLQSDLDSHTNAEEHKRVGDLLLANLSTARRKGNRVTLVDYFADKAPPVEIEIDESASLQEEAQRRFAMYSRSKRAIAQINSRMEIVRVQLRDLKAQEKSIEIDLAKEQQLTPGTESEPPGLAAGSLSFKVARDKDKSKRIPGARRYVSADNFEILVGRTSKDNDHLTFKIAKPNDLWLHAADYGGSHVVVRNSTRKDVPRRTLVEAAQLAAWFSQAKKDPKVDVHYTERKFVTKPKGGKAGLVRLQRFKNITVTPTEAATRVV